MHGILFLKKIIKSQGVTPLWVVNYKPVRGVFQPLAFSAIYKGIHKGTKAKTSILKLFLYRYVPYKGIDGPSLSSLYLEKNHVGYHAI